MEGWDEHIRATRISCAGPLKAPWKQSDLGHDLVDDRCIGKDGRAVLERNLHAFRE